MGEMRWLVLYCKQVTDEVLTVDSHSVRQVAPYPIVLRSKKEGRRNKLHLVASEFDLLAMYTV